MGREPVTGKDYADFVQENASVWKEAWRRVCGDNAVIRSDDRWDGTVKHLGYTSINVQWHVRDTLARAIMTDKDLIKASQERLREVEVIPAESLSHRQRVNLKLARAITDEICRIRKVSAVHAVIIPPASDGSGRQVCTARPPGNIHCFRPTQKAPEHDRYGGS